MTEKTKQFAPFGLWPSPVTSALISQRTAFEDVQFAGDGQTLVWREGRSGKGVLVAQTGCAARRDLTDEPAPSGGVGYGGASFSISGETVLFASRDGRVYRRGLGLERPRAITPPFGPEPAGKVAAPTLSPDGQWALYVYSDGKNDLLALVDANGANWPNQLARGADFYMQPAWHPNSRAIAWVEWDVPNMPWDGARVQLATLEGTPPRIKEVQTVGGGDQIPAQLPLFSPDGRWLSFTEESGEWPDLIVLDLQTGQRRVLIHGDGFDIAPPAWVQGLRSMAWSADSRFIYYIRSQDAQSSLWRVAVEDGRIEQIETGALRPAQITAAPQGSGVAFIASASNLPDQIVRWDGEQLQVVAYSAAATYDPAYLPVARPFHWPTSDSAQANGLYYPPANPAYTAEGLPPAIVHIHGGPTSAAADRFSPNAAYFTSRGYAYVEVNYRGSTGYGRAYRQVMRQRWGDVDVEDAASCARALGSQQLADPARLVIMGGSAGGYTVLNTLIRYPGLFKAGVCLYGVTNLYALDLDTHKFEAHYNITMIGRLPEAAGRYQAWSPVFNAGQIRDALYIFQGSEDKVVPPSQAEAIVAALREKGVPYQYKLYEGEGHGFRKAETIADFLKETERFLQMHVLFAP